MKCPSCDMELSDDDVLVPIWSYGGELIDCIHIKTQIWEAFLKTCEERGWDIDDVFESFLRGAHNYKEV